MAAPVIVGLAVGLVFVVLFASQFNSSSPIVQRKFYSDVSIIGLKDAYRVGENIDFTIRATGYGANCGPPSVMIMDTSDPKKTINPVDVHIEYNCDPEAFYFDRSWTLLDIGVMHDIVLEGGHYNVIVGYGATVEKEFDVISSDRGMSVTSEQVPEGTVLEVNITDSDNDPVYSKLPEMSMIVHTPDNDSGLTFAWEGRIGSYCWGGVCADTAFIVPELSIEIKKGSTIEFQISNNEQPDELGVIVYKGENKLADQQLASLGTGEYKIDLPRGNEYILFMGASWKDGEYSAGSAVYYYKIQVI